ncbi:cysteine desulfurase-like protein [Actinomycetes bacterium]|nr:cysteine desulfurase-like protein [Actinomycetes bacterium]
MTDAIRRRFPGSQNEWARFDGPAGTQMVDAAIRAASDWSSSGNNANTHGAFAAAHATDALLERARGVVAQLLDTDPNGVVFGANMTTMTFALTRAIARTLKPGDRVVGTRLDHDANVSPWRIACEESGAEHVLAPFSPIDGRLDMDAMAKLITPNTKWVAVTGASNLIGTMPDIKTVVALARHVGARVFVDAVHLVPHMPVSVRDIGCDVLATSPYKWYGPHAGVLCIEPNLLNALPVAKVRPADDVGPRRFETGTPNLENIAATEAAARHLLEENMASVAKYERDVFAPLLQGLLSMPRVKVWGPPTLEARTPTVAFTVDGLSPDRVAEVLAAKKIAVWAGSSYAVELVSHLGLAESGGVVRAGVVRYVTPDDVQRLLTAVAAL